MNDFHELRLEAKCWAPGAGVGLCSWPSVLPCCCDTQGLVYVFGGYDGSNRLNDFLEFRFGFGGADIPASSLVTDLKQLVNSELLSDVTFVVEGQEVPAHKVLCLRCPYFRALFTGDMRESLMDRIAINDVRKDIFLRLLEYLYTDDVEVDLDMAMELVSSGGSIRGRTLEAHVRVAHARKSMWRTRRPSSTRRTSTRQHHYAEKCLAFVLANFDAVTRTRALRGDGPHERIWCLRSSRRGTVQGSCKRPEFSFRFPPRGGRLIGLPREEIALATGKSLARKQANQRRSRTSPRALRRVHRTTRRLKSRVSRVACRRHVRNAALALGMYRS